MINERESCIVAPPRECNYATIPPKNATDDATKLQQHDLITLSKRVLASSTRNRHCNNSATRELQHHRASIINELRVLIKTVSQNHGGDDDAFLNKYIDDVISENHDNLMPALSCFRDLANKSSHLLNGNKRS